MASDFDLHIERLVLHGVVGCQQLSFSEAFIRELERLLQKGQPAMLAFGEGIIRLDPQTVMVKPRAGADAIGTCVAQSVFQALIR